MTSIFRGCSMYFKGLPWLDLETAPRLLLLTALLPLIERFALLKLLFAFE